MSHTLLSAVAMLLTALIAALAVYLTDKAATPARRRPRSKTRYLVLAVVLAVVTIPAHALFLTPPWTATHTRAEPGGAASKSHAATVLRSRTFIGLAAAMTVAAFGMYAATVGRWVRSKTKSVSLIHSGMVESSRTAEWQAVEAMSRKGVAWTR